MPHPHLKVASSPAGYRWLRLDRPERRNALDVSLMAAVRDALSAEPEAPVLLGSTDPRVFCAGADLTISHAERAQISDMIYDCCQTMITRPGPVIAVLTGRRSAVAHSLPPPVTCGSPARPPGCAGSARPALTWRWGPGYCRSLSAAAWRWTWC